MLITDLFSHKIHSSSDTWPDKLIDIATIFSEFDGRPYNRGAIEDSFRRISPRASLLARDPSKYRDEISAYPAYLGLYRMQYENDAWVLRLSEAAKRFLVVEEPNIPAFMLLQLLLFQFPNGNGATYNNRNGTVNIKPNAASKTLEFVRNEVHLSPLRLICKALLADSELNGISPLHPRVSVNEIGLLANDARINKQASPPLGIVTQILDEYRSLETPGISGFERRFHILNHTDFIQVINGWIHLRETYSPEDAARQLELLRAIGNTNIQFEGFDSATSKKDLEEVVLSGAWGNYFDGAVTLTADIVQLVSNEASLISPPPFPSVEPQEADDLIPDNTKLKFKYPLRERDSDFSSVPSGPGKNQPPTDPEVTRIKRQKSNLMHKIIMSQLDEYLRALDAVPLENEHIDMYAKIPGYGGFLFEVKSVSNENLLSQTRKGLSQLYEYRYRYRGDIEEDVTLCLVYPKEPKDIEWLQEYLCLDRDIAVCWFANDLLQYPKFCSEKMKTIDSRASE